MPALQRVEIIVGTGFGELRVRDARLREVGCQAIADRDEVVILNLIPGLYQVERMPEQYRQLIQVQPTTIGLTVDLSCT